MKDLSNLKALFQSKNDRDIEIAEQIAIGMGLHWLEIFRLKHETGATITDNDAIKSGVTDNSCNVILKCFKCESENLETKILDTLQGQVCEEETTCKTCGNTTYWGYGNFDFNNIT